jgi:hypothetical protein
MPSREMQDVMDALRDRQKVSASQPPPTLEQRRAACKPGRSCGPAFADHAVHRQQAPRRPVRRLAA